MISVILSVLLAIFLLLILALLFPVKIFLKAAGGDDTDIRADGRVMLFAGLLGGGGSYTTEGSRISAYLGGWKILDGSAATIIRRARKKKTAPETEKTGKAEKPDKKRKEHAERKLSLSERIREWRRTYSFIKKTALRGLRGLLRVDHCRARVKFGLDNPALTGQLIGIIYAVNGILPERYVIVPSWDFSRRVFSGEVDIKLTFRTYLFWKYLVLVLMAYLRFRRELQPVPGDDLKAREV